MFWRRKRSPDDFREEIRTHLQLEVDDLKAEGLDEHAASVAARREFGNVTLAQELFDEKRRRRWFNGVVFDVRHAARGLWRRRAFSLLAIVTAGFAIGATTAVYSTVDWLLNRPPGGVIEPDRLVGMLSTDGESSLTFSYPWYQAIRETQDVFTDLAAHAKIPGVVSTETRSSQFVFEFVTGNYFPLLGVQPELGRVIGPDDDVPGGVPNVMLSHAFWLRQFSGDPAVVGQSLTLNGQPVIVVGIMSHVFEGYRLN